MEKPIKKNDKEVIPSASKSEESSDLAEKILDKQTLSELERVSPELAQKIHSELSAVQIVEVCHEIEARRFSGPLPPPEVLKEYDGILAGGAEKIFEMAKKEQNHRHDMEQKAITAASSEKKRGQIFGFVVSTTAILASVACAAIGAYAVAGIIGGTTVIGLATVFVIGKTIGRNENIEEPDEETDPTG